jgi:cytochrome b
LAQVERPAERYSSHVLSENNRPRESGNLERRLIIVWDVPTRLFHWLVAMLVPAAYATQKLDWMGWHVRVGEALLMLLIFRLFWGIFGSDTAKFHRFLASPGAVFRHLAQVFRREPDLAIGHNAAGGWSVFLLLGLLLGETLSGLYVNNDVADEGPLTEWVPAPVSNAIAALHQVFWYALLCAIALHLLAIVIYAVAKGQNLVLPMLTGRKLLSARPPPMAGISRAMLILALSVVATFLLATTL